jgi:arginine utilization protein RocB
VRDTLAERAREIALALTSWPSATGTPQEAAFAPKLADYLSHFDAWMEAISGGRANVFALKKGASARTIVLAGHFDTVPFDDYGDLAPLALDPEGLREAMIARLKRSGESALALADLESGDFLPGRGLLDMKSGLAAGIAAMEAYDGAGSILFVATPDEEDRSAGMRAAAPRIAEIAREHGLDIALFINLDAISDQGDGGAGRVVAMGSIGKQLLAALAVGKEAHACYPQDGANAAYLAAELACAFELAPELAESTGDELAAPPTALSLKDSKSGYNVTTPAQAFAYWNTLQHRRSADDVMGIALGLAKGAMARAMARVGRAVPVYRYCEVLARAPKQEIADYAAELAGRGALDLPERTRLLMAHVWSRSGLAGPAVVLGFGSIPYAAVALGDDALERRIMGAAGKHGLGAIRYFPGISDMSFAGRAPAAGANPDTPLAGSGFDMPEPAGYPAINIGPWGRDYHHWLERLHAPYAFETLPRVVLGVAGAVLDGG